MSTAPTTRCLSRIVALLSSGMVAKVRRLMPGWRDEATQQGIVIWLEKTITYSVQRAFPPPLTPREAKNPHETLDEETDETYGETCTCTDGGSWRTEHREYRISAGLP